MFIPWINHLKKMVAFSVFIYGLCNYMQVDYRTVPPTDPQVVSLIEKLNIYQEELYGAENCNLETPESLLANKALMIGAYAGNNLAGIGGIKLLRDHAEVKRMFVEENYRGLGIAESILKRLESYAQKNGVREICLETGNLHSAALAFYRKLGYEPVESFGNYKPNSVSLYFSKKVN
jgi:putative acetyltransferase